MRKPPVEAFLLFCEHFLVFGLLSSSCFQPEERDCEPHYFRILNIFPPQKMFLSFSQSLNNLSTGKQLTLQTSLKNYDSQKKVLPFLYLVKKPLPFGLLHRGRRL